jgi:beta-lactamase regulating signal transducer with metallopeptidase domain
MSDALLDHLWQSTLFACAAALLTLAFRKNAASIRFEILLAASLKFLLPFSLLVLVGAHLHRSTAPAPGAQAATPPWHLLVSRVMYPASFARLYLGPAMEPVAAADISASQGPPSSTTAVEAITPSGSTAPVASAMSRWAPSNWRWSTGAWLLLAWSIGSVVLLFRWLLQWMKLRAVVAAATPLEIEAPIPVREAATTFEPGICGIFSPVLLLPQGISTCLTSTELDSVLEHELSHWWRRDNLTGALHMFVAAVFWFHPLVWWLGWRLVIERERACDEQVIQSGTERQIYAGAILKVCRLYLEPPLLCTAGVSGGTLRKRIEDIMTNQVGMRMHLAKKCLLSAAAAAAIAAPVAIGLALGPQSLAQAQGATTGDSTQHYQNTEWNFGLDIPPGWNRFPADLSSSPHEVIRFGSGEGGRQLLIVFRNFFDTQKGLGAYITAVEQSLEKKDRKHFVTGEATLGSRHVTTLDFDWALPDGSNWSTHQYLLIQGSLVYTLSFGSNSKQPTTLTPMEDRVATSFTFGTPDQRVVTSAMSTFTMGALSANGTQHYQNTEWKFGLDVPKGWNRFPPVMANSPFEVVRFGSGENGYQILIIFRNGIDAQSGLAAHIAAVEQALGKAGFGNFATGQVTMGSRQVTTLDFNRTNSDGTTWSCRHYIFVDGSLIYTLGFGNSAKPDAVLAQQESIARSFTFEPST